MTNPVPLSQTTTFFPSAFIPTSCKERKLKIVFILITDKKSKYSAGECHSQSQFHSQAQLWHPPLLLLWSPNQTSPLQLSSSIYMVWIKASIMYNFKRVLRMIQHTQWTGQELPLEGLKISVFLRDPPDPLGNPPEMKNPGIINNSQHETLQGYNFWGIFNRNMNGLKLNQPWSTEAWQYLYF